MISDPGAAVSVAACRGRASTPSDPRKVLRRFYRLEPSRTKPRNGLGLSAVAAIADLHRATITLLDNGPGLRVVMMFPGSLITKPYRLGDAAPTRAAV